VEKSNQSTKIKLLPIIVVILIIICAGLIYTNVQKNTLSPYVSNSMRSIVNTENFQTGALEHIFEGQINREGEAVGFHYEGFPTAKGEIIAGTKTSPNRYGAYEGRVRVNGISKTSNSGKSTFYPSSWTPQVVVSEINQAYNNKRNTSGNTYIGKATNGMQIMMYISSNGKIISAFPIY